MSNILQELTKASDRWAKTDQAQMVEATIVSIGNSSTTYTIQFKNGARASNIKGPSGLSVGKSILVASYGGKIKKHAIVQQASGGGVGTITSVQV
jgi:hypothetical protein